MSFVAEFNKLPLAALLKRSSAATTASVREAQAQTRITLADFAELISPAASEWLEPVCRRSQALTQQRFGKVIRLFAPLYLSNECVNNCQYCGFSRDNPILRVTLSVDEVLREARALKEQGFRNILLVAGEHPRFVSKNYLADCVRTLHDEFPGISLEVGPMETEDYRPIVRAGAEGLVVYQETYDRALYAELHTAGPKRDFNWRMETPERAYAAGFRRLRIATPVGITLMSAGSHTEPGGYTGAGKEHLHQTVHGRIVELGASEWASDVHATGQFDIADERSPMEVADRIRRLGYEPVWKDWDAAL